jgi:hypothetical protein
MRTTSEAPSQRRVAHKLIRKEHEEISKGRDRGKGSSSGNGGKLEGILITASASKSGMEDDNDKPGRKVSFVDPSETGIMKALSQHFSTVRIGTTALKGTAY